MASAASIVPAAISLALLLAGADWHVQQAILISLGVSAVIVGVSMRGMARPMAAFAGASIPLTCWPIEWEGGVLVYMHQYLADAAVDVPLPTPGWPLLALGCAVAWGLFHTAWALARRRVATTSGPATIALCLASGLGAAFAMQGVLWAVGTTL